MMRRQKLFRFIVRETHFRFQCAIVLGVAALICVQAAIVGKQAAEVADLKARRDLVAKIPEMEGIIAKRIVTPAMIEAAQKQIARIESVLQGTMLQDGVYDALIDGQVYTVGGMIGDFRIVAIGMDSISLENGLTREVTKLYFPVGTATELSP